MSLLEKRYENEVYQDHMEKFDTLMLALGKAVVDLRDFQQSEDSIIKHVQGVCFRWQHDNRL